MLLMVSVSALAFVGFWVVHRMNEVQEFLAEVRSEYQELNAAYTFSPPPSSVQLAEDRLKAYLRARGALMSSLTPDIDARAQELLDSSSLRDVNALRLLGNFYQFSRSASGAHIAALESERMSLDEYLWIHGLIMRDALAAEQDDPRRAALERVLARLEDFTEAHASAEQAFSSDGYRAELREVYRGRGPLSDAPLHLADDRAAEPAHVLGDLIDLLAASPSLIQSLELGSSPSTGG
ncbi:hypothetical protein IIC65_04205 [Candidatus Sumerlaeota bacterium]|nr:hypothetical protein [Candidatus Sumerlaeota bacterium]